MYAAGDARHRHVPHPGRLGDAIAATRRRPSVLAEVRVHRGMPVADFEPRFYGLRFGPVRLGHGRRPPLGQLGIVHAGPEFLGCDHELVGEDVTPHFGVINRAAINGTGARRAEYHAARELDLKGRVVTARHLLPAPAGPESV